MASSIRAIDSLSIHRIASGQVVTSLTTAVKELVENSLDAGSTNIEVRFKDYGLESIEVIDNGSGIAPEDYDTVALHHHTSKLEKYEDLPSVSTFGFRGEALSSICALSGSVTVTTTTLSTSPMGTILQLDKNGRVTDRSGKIARQRGTTVVISKLFLNLPVRRKELERNAKREYGKTLNLLNAYALVPCTSENQGVRLICTNQVSGRKNVAFRTDGTTSVRSSISALWGPKALENLVDLDLTFEIEIEKSFIRRQALLGNTDVGRINQIVRVRGLISKFTVGGGRTGTDRQFFYINGRPCTLTKVQKAFNDVYRSFNANQSPFIVADFIIPKDCLDINVSPDKRTIFVHNENNLIQSLKMSLEETFSPSRSTFELNHSQARQNVADTRHTISSVPLFLPDEEEARQQPTQGSTAASDESIVTFGRPDILVDSSPSLSFTSSPGGTSATGLGITVSQASQLTELVNPLDGKVSQLDTPTSPPVARLDLQTDDTVKSGSVDSIDVDKRNISKGVAEAGMPREIIDVNLPNALCEVRQRGQNDTSTRPRRTGEMSKPVQIVLATEGTSWNKRRESSETPERPAKRHKSNHVQLARNEIGTNPPGMADLRQHLLDFARTGSQLTMEEAPEQESDDDTNNNEAVAADELDSEAGERAGGEESIHDVLDENNTVAHHDCFEPDMDIAAEGQAPEHGEVDSRAIGLTQEGYSTSAMEIALRDSDICPTSTENSSVTRPPEIVRTTQSDDTSINLDFATLKASWEQLCAQVASSNSTWEGADPQDWDTLSREAGIQNDSDKAQEALSRIIDKSDFLTMEVVGQFNRGFIIARRRKHDNAGRLLMDDLFIIDQHAADEKYNFEQLQQTTKIESQKLIRPQVIELAASDELLAIDNIEVLRQNGFEIEVDEATGQSHRQRLLLVAKPVSKTTEFSMKDLEELINLMHDQPQGRMVRCSKARAMFASRACRKSVMIGHPLQLPHLTSIVRHMGTMSQPWNCPHGRPTMRHLSDILPAEMRSGTLSSVRRRNVDFDSLDN